MKLIKKVTAGLFIIFILTLSIYIFNNSNTRTVKINELPSNLSALKLKKITLKNWLLLKPIEDINITSKSAILIDAETGNILYEKNINNSLPIASMSKIMTEFIILDAIKNGEINWDDPVPISDYAYSISNKPGYSSAKLRQDDLYTVEELFHVMAIRSANGATIALAELVSGSEKKFVEQMNDKAKQLKLFETRFFNSTGITNNQLNGYDSVGGPNDTNHMSAHDVALLASSLIQAHPEILNITILPEYDFNNEKHLNSNFMLTNNKLDFLTDDVTFPNVDGLKTGFTDEAKDCFAGTVKINGKRFVSVIMGAEERLLKFSETKLLYEEIEKQLY